jgi:thioredoxin-like negative regulator of GroEL
MTIHTNLSVPELEALVFNDAGRKFLFAFNRECSACSTMHPVVDELHAELQPNMPFIHVDVNERPEIWDAFEMTTVPSYFVIEDGTVVAEGYGALKIEQLRDLVRTVAAD